jgi:hypothetical protein
MTRAMNGRSSFTNHSLTYSKFSSRPILLVSSCFVVGLRSDQPVFRCCPSFCLAVFSSPLWSLCSKRVSKSPVVIALEGNKVKCSFFQWLTQTHSHHVFLLFFDNVMQRLGRLHWIYPGIRISVAQEFPHFFLDLPSY